MNTFPASTKVFSCQTDHTESTILVVEDEPAVREVTRAVLEHAGYRVLVCSGPDEALRVGSEHRKNIGLLLTDVVMPGMNGAELVERLQNLQTGLTTVFVSRYAERHVLHEVLHDDRMNYIQKPFTINTLLTRVAAALRKHAEVSEPAVGVSTQ